MMNSSRGVSAGRDERSLCDIVRSLSAVEFLAPVWGYLLVVVTDAFNCCRQFVGSARMRILEARMQQSPSNRDIAHVVVDVVVVAATANYEGGVAASLQCTAVVKDVVAFHFGPPNSTGQASTALPFQLVGSLVVPVVLLGL